MEIGNYRRKEGEEEESKQGRIKRKRDRKEGE